MGNVILGKPEDSGAHLWFPQTTASACHYDITHS